MMTRTTSRIVVLAAICFAVSFAVTVASRSAPEDSNALRSRSPVGIWLGLDAETDRLITQHNPTFSDDLKAAQAQLVQARQRLAELLEDPGTEANTIRAQVETAIAARNRLERLVIENIIAAREHLTPAQQRCLLRLCADEVRACKKRAGGAAAAADGCDNCAKCTQESDRQKKN